MPKSKSYLCCIFILLTIYKISNDSCILLLQNVIVKLRFYITPDIVFHRLLCEGPLTKKCNVYSFGVVLLEIMSGKPAHYVNKTYDER